MIRSLLFVAFVSACTSDTSSGIAASEVTCPSDSTLTYASFGQVFISDNCLSCHTSKERPTLTTQAAVKTNASAIIDAAVLSVRMPASGSMSTDERKLLGEWLACGAP